MPPYPNIRIFQSVFTLSSFKYDAAEHNLYADASALRLRPSVPPADDISVVSHVTGRTVHFHLHDVVVHADGDIIAWHFKPQAAEMSCGVTDLYIDND